MGVLFCHKKKKKILAFAMAWMDFKGLMLSEISQTDKDKYCMISLIYEISEHQTQETE